MNWINAKDRLPESDDKVYVYCIGHCYFKFEPDFDECIAQCKLPEGESAWNCPRHRAVPHWREASCCGYPSHKIEDDDYWIALDDIPKPEMK